jgi:hypothetical protein
MRYAISADYRSVIDTETWSHAGDIPVGVDPATAVKDAIAAIKRRKWVKLDKTTWQLDAGSYVLEVVRPYKRLSHFRVMRDGQYLVEPNGQIVVYYKQSFAQSAACRYSNMELLLSANPANATKFPEDYRWQAPINADESYYEYITFYAGEDGDVVHFRLNFAPTEEQRAVAKQLAEGWVIRNAIGQCVARLVLEGQERRLTERLTRLAQRADTLGLDAVEACLTIGSLSLAGWQHEAPKAGGVWVSIPMDFTLPGRSPVVDNPKIKALIKDALQQYLAARVQHRARPILSPTTVPEGATP